ncbi:phosphodiester glycosidase family protein [Paenibacillus taiwanensis]|uniref:phosphodiester glycosidase family protein n=1 Tax=Paenibacillus taiwanensis TaxID=401638 RepID=UPI000563AFD9|nr:phosphodiester glycosidase family protein [Paenibacillus taiwanensis]
MKHIKRTMSLLLIVMLLTSLGSPMGQAMAADTGSPSNAQVLDERRMSIGPGATYVWQDMKLKQGLEKVHYVEFDPSNPMLDVQAGRTNGKVYGMTGVTQMANDADKPGNRVVAAINGDFYDMSTGVPLGLFMDSGRILVSPPYKTDWYAFGLREDGTTVYDLSPTLERTITIGGDIVNISHINRMRDNSESLMLYTSDFHTSTLTNDLGDEVVLDVLSGEVKSGSSLKLKVADIHKDKGDTSLTDGQVVLSASGKYRDVLAKLKRGDEVEAHFEMEDAWKNVKMAIGGVHILLKQGTVQPHADKTLQPRVAIGTKADGSIMMMVIDGRAPGFSEGVSYDDLALIMKQAGAEDALCLDGGGSSTFVARLPGEPKRSVLNQPSDGHERKTANGILLVNKAPEGPAHKLVVQPSFERVLTGSTVAFKSAGVDASGHPTSMTASPTWNVDAAVGSIDAQGRFTAGTVAGTAEIRAAAGSLTGSGQVEVVDTLTELRLPDAVRTVTSGGKVPLSVTALRDGQVIRSSQNQFDWKVEGPIGTVDANGVFTATNDTQKEGRVIVSHKGVTASMDVKVGLPPIILEDFENGVDRYHESSGARFKRVRASEESSEDFVRFGQKSIKLEYDFREQLGTSGAYVAAKDKSQWIEIPGYPEKISAWVYGDGKKHWLRSQLRDGNDAAVGIDWIDASIGVDWVGWKYVEVNVPKGRPLPLRIDQPFRYMETNNNKKDEGVLYFDQLRALYGPVQDDMNPPLIKDVTPQDGATVHTNTPKIQVVAEDDGYDAVKHPGTTLIDPNSIRMYVDGVQVNATLYPPKGQIHYTPSVPLADGVHAVRVRVKDESGNMTEKNWTFTVDTGASKIVYSGNPEVYAGETYTVNIKAIKAAEIRSGYVEYRYDRQLVDSVQVDKHVSLTEAQLRADVDEAKGMVRITFNDLNTSSLQDDQIMAAIRFKLKAEAEGHFKLHFETGAFKLKDKGETLFAFYGLPVEATIKNQLQLTWEEDGIAHGYETVFHVRDEQGLPVEGASIVTVDGLLVGVTAAGGQVQSSILTAEVKEYVIRAIKAGQYSRTHKFKVSKLFGTASPHNISVSMGVDASSSRGFTWHTHPNTTNTVVELVKKKDFTDFTSSSVQKVIGSSYIFNTTDIGTVRVHKAVAEGLEPNTTYVYRVGDGSGNYSAEGSFKTAGLGDERTKFVYIADSQATDDAGFKLWGDILDKAMTDHPDAQFLLHTGDIVEDGYKENEWNLWFKHAQEQLLKTTIVSVVGNHEVTGPNKNDYFLAHFNHPQNGIDKLKGTSYSFDYKDVHIAVLNSEYEFEAQQEWLRQDLAATKKKWKLVTFHRGPYGSVYDTEHIRKQWAPVMDEFKVDLVLNGHDHVYMRSHPMKGEQVVGNGEGTTYVIAGSSGPKFYAIFDRYWQKVVDDEKTQIYTAVEVEGDELKFVAKTKTGRVVDQFVLTKPESKPEQILIDRTQAEMAVGEAIKLNATVMPEGTYDRSVTWSVYQAVPTSPTTGRDVVQVTPDGVVTALQLGQAWVRAQSVVASVYADALITVNRPQQVEIKGVEVSPTIAKLKVGDTLQARAVVLPTDLASQSVVWSVYGSHAAGIVKVTDQGLITGLKPGTALIRVISQVDSSKYADMQLTVEPSGPVIVPVQNVMLSRSSATLKEGEGLQLTATVLPANATNASVVWSVYGQSAMQDIVEVSQTGFIRAMKEGKAIIRVTSLSDVSKYADFTLTVVRRTESGGDTSTPNQPSRPETGKPDTDKPNISDTAYGVKVVAGRITGTAQVDVNNRHAVIELPSKVWEEALSQASADEGGVRRVRFDVAGTKDAVQLEVKLPTAAVAAGNLKTRLLLVTDMAEVVFASNTWSSSNSSNQISLIVRKEDAAAIPSSLFVQVGNRPVISVYAKQGEQLLSWNKASEASRIGITYKPQPAELAKTQGIIVWHINEAGVAAIIPNGRYDAKSGAVQLLSQEPGTYAIAYVNHTFRDVQSMVWAREAVEFLAARNVVKGVDGNSFAPARSVTRADYIVMLVRALGLTAQHRSGFMDVASDKYYYEAVSIAKSLGITQGVGQERFKPNQAISREEMIVMTARALKQANRLDVAYNPSVMSPFEDAKQVNSYAAASVSTLVEAGVLTGSGNRLYVQRHASRAEVAVLLTRVLQVVY